MEKKSVWLHVLVSALFCSAIAALGTDPERVYSVPQGQFASGLSGWSQYSSSGTNLFTAAAGPSTGHATAVRGDGSAPGHFGSLWTSIAVGTPGSAIEELPAAGEFGEKVEYGAWIYVDDVGSATSSDSIELILNAHNGSSNVPIASVRIHPALSTVPKDRWFFATTQPSPTWDARIQSNTSSLTMAIRIEAPGTYYFDDIQVGRFEYSEYPSVAGDFEGATPLSGWTVSAQVAASNVATDEDGYYGERFVKLSGTQDEWAYRALSLSEVPGEPKANQECEAGVWVLVPTGESTPSVVLTAYSSRTPFGTGPLSASYEIAQTTWTPQTRDRGTWTYLETSLTAAIPWGHNYVALEVVKGGAGEIWIDHAQLGERYALHGNPRRQVMAAMVGWYRSPFGPDSVASLSTPAKRWQNWYSERKPCDSECGATFSHNPDSAATSGCNSDPTPSYRANGRRDLAVSVDTDTNDLPLVGAYDSRDQAIVALQLDLMAAAGMRTVLYNYFGHALGQQEAAQSGGESVKEQSFDRVLDLADDDGRNMKVSPMYEPQVHFNGWIAHSTFADRVAGVVDDLTYLVDLCYARKCIQKLDGRMIIYLFNQRQCISSTCLEDADWQSIVSAVETNTGRSICLIGTGLGSSGYAAWYPSFAGMMKWNLIDSTLFKYQTYAHAVSQTQSQFPALSALATHAATVLRQGDMWARANDKQRIGIGTIWPGFDDSGVAGWGGANPACVRVLESFNGQFLDTTAAAALARELDWVQVATWNDWNEFTAVEPAYNPDWVAAVQNQQTPSQAAVDDVFGRLTDVQDFAREFLGSPVGAALDVQDLYDIATAYVTGPDWTAYD
jgi:hypothetical protein